MALQDLRAITSYHQSQFYKAVVFFVYLAYWILALLPFFKNKNIYFLYVLIWCGEISFTFYFTLKYEVNRIENSLNGLVALILYVTHVMGHIIVLIESCVMFSNRDLLFQHFSTLRKTMDEKLKAKENLKLSVVRLGRVVIGILVMLACGHSIVTATALNPQSQPDLLYWRSLQNYLVLHFKTLEFLSGLLQLNYYIITIRQLLNETGERNLKRIFKKLNLPSKMKIIQTVTVNEQENDHLLLKMLKSTLNDVYIVFQLYKETQGWSLLSATVVYFIDFVSNSYWALEAILTHNNDGYCLLQNVSFALMAFILLSVTCWYAEECYYESRLIGCLVSKLAKPLGNKYYNDLVSEFSVQTLHQRFTITAKEFFNLNLSLLGKMVAATVTYLVILIQFMQTENTKTESTA